VPSTSAVDSPTTYCSLTRIDATDRFRIRFRHHDERAFVYIAYWAAGEELRGDVGVVRGGDGGGGAAPE
jgi:hypothetical protein